MRTLVQLSALLLLAGCAASGSGRLPVCDGHSRRPANPHGSVLIAPELTLGLSSPAPADTPTGGCA